MIREIGLKRDKYRYSLDFVVILLFNLITFRYSNNTETIIFLNIVTNLAAYFLVFLYFLLNIKYTLVEKLLILLVIMINTSFVMITGNPYSKLPLSGFNIILLLLFVYSLVRCRVKSTIKKYLIIIIIFTIIILIKLFFLQNEQLSSALKQSINLFAFLLCVPIGEAVKPKCRENFGMEMNKYYIFSVLSFAIIIIYQYILFNSFNQIVGILSLFGDNRISYAGLFNDYSFASVYLVTGIAIILQNILDKQERLTFNNFICLLFIGVASLIVNARTGFVGFAFAFIIYACIEIISYLKHHKISIRNTLLFLMIFMVIPILIMLLMNNRGQETVFTDNGRINTYTVGINMFFEHFLFGGTLGIENYGLITNATIPHNFVVQILAQTGIAGFILICFYIVFLIYDLVNKNQLALLTILCCSMFIPDILNSRFIITIIISSLLFRDSCRLKKYENNKIINVVESK